MKKRMLFVVNPSSGTLKIKDSLLEVCQIFGEYGYEITLNVASPRFSKYEYYMDICDGRLPRLLNVPGFDGILLHVGTTAENSSGCILVGYNKIKGKLTEGKMVFAKLYDLMKEAKDRGEKITIEIY